MTELTITDVYAFGVPIILALILFEVLVSNWQNKNYYNFGDTWCTSGLLFGNILMGFAIKGSIVGFVGGNRDHPRPDHGAAKQAPAKNCDGDCG